MRTAVFALAFVLTAVAVPAYAQVDLSGEWGQDNHEDQPHRGPGPDLGDYTGLPINAAARRKAESWDASVLGQPEQQAKPHPAQYSLRGPGPNFVIRRVLDELTGRLVAYTLAGTFGRSDRTIWMDGRPHPGRYAEHTWAGFSTGEWVNNGTALKVTTTHLKTSFINRNGVPSSYKSLMVEFLTRHGDRLSHFVWIDDPVYLEEPFVRTNEFALRLEQHTGPALPFETIDELGDKPPGWVPSYPIGTQHRDLADRSKIPFEATRGGKESLYPEYMQKIEQMKQQDTQRGAK